MEEVAEVIKQLQESTDNRVAGLNQMITDLYYKIVQPAIETSDELKKKVTQVQQLADENKKELSSKANQSDIPDRMTWAQITDKPNLATKDELPVIPKDLVHTDQLDKVKTNIDTAQVTADQALTIANDAKAGADQAEQTATQAKQTAAQAVAIAQNVKAAINVIYTNKKPSDYTDGIFYEQIQVGSLGVDRTSYGQELSYSDVGILTTKVVTSGNSRYARQRFEVISSRYPYTYERNGSGDAWSSWHGTTLWD